MCESKKKKFCNELSMQVKNLLVKFHREKYNLYKSHKNMTKTSTNTI